MKKSVVVIVAVLLISCWAKKPHLNLSKDYTYIEDKNGIILQNVDIVQYDSIDNFIASKNIYKKSESEGSKKIYFFEDNTGYHHNDLNKLFLHTGYIYKVHVHTLGFEDSVSFKIK